MMSGHTIPDNLKLVLDHLNAARELERYLRKKSVYRDLERYTKDVVVPRLLQRFPTTLGSWESDIDENGAEWFPESWRLDDDHHASLYLLMANPVDPDFEDSLPSINLWVSTEWAGYKLLRGSSPAWHKNLKKSGFEFIDDHKDWLAECLSAKSVNWLKEDGCFDEDDLIERIANATETLVELEPMIGESIREASVQCPAKKQPKQGEARRRNHR
jgi:hypothetical protein